MPIGLYKDFKVHKYPVLKFYFIMFNFIVLPTTLLINGENLASSYPFIYLAYIIMCILHSVS